MKRMIKFPSIGQFRTICKNIKYAAQYDGWDEENKSPILNLGAKIPTINIIGTEKIHGCLKYDTLITTKEYGDIPIKEIVDNKLKCYVLTRNLETDENEWNIVENSWVSDKSKKWLKITLEDNTELFLTEDHKVFNPKNREYIEAKKIKENDVVLKK